MRITSKDATGLVLAATTVGLLAFHGTDRHDPVLSGALDRVEVIAPEAAAVDRSRTVAFVDVTVAAVDGEGARKHQTVVVADGVVREIGALDEVSPPADAWVVVGDGADVLFPAEPDAAGRSARIDRSKRIVRGASADLLLVEGYSAAEGRAARPAGLMVRGVWYPPEALLGVSSRGSRITGGH